MMLVQVLLLTAIMPPFMKLDLRIANTCSIWEMIQAETMRSKIEYEIMEMNEKKDEKKKKTV